MLGKDHPQGCRANIKYWSETQAGSNEKYSTFGGVILFAASGSFGVGGAGVTWMHPDQTALYPIGVNWELRVLSPQRVLELHFSPPELSLHFDLLINLPSLNHLN